MILDASVVLAWLLKESDGVVADRLLSRADLSAPTLIAAEVGHALTKYARRGAITREAAQSAWRAFDLLPLRLLPLEAVAQRAFELSQAVHGVFYDCLYLALAERDRDLLVTLDERFLRAVQAGGQGLATHISSLADAP